MNNPASPPRPRLHPRHLATLPASVARPAWWGETLEGDASQPGTLTQCPLTPGPLTPGIVHLGIGAFMRAHLVPATEAAMARSGQRHWGVVGVSLRQPDTRDALAPQHGLYTLALRDADAQGRPRQRLQVLGAVQQLLVAPEDPAAVLQAIAAPATRIVSLTVTEKGYCHDPASGRLQLQHPDIDHDRRHPQAPRSAIGYLVHGLALRRARGGTGLSLLSLDNLPANGHVLRQAVLDLATAVDPALARWIATECRFPCSMVDRIVPRTTDADRQAVAATLGLDDAWPVLAEPFFDWAVEDHFVGGAAGRPDWAAGTAAWSEGGAAGGARFVADAEPWERLKLRMVNGAHSCIAYLGHQAGWATVDVAMRQPALQAFVQRLLLDEVAPTLPALPGLDQPAYVTQLLARFANPALAHRTLQIAMDGSQKLPQRLLGTVRQRLTAGQPIPHLALGLAAWLHHLRGVDEAGRPYPVDDPQAAVLQALHQQHLAAGATAAGVHALLAHGPVFGDLAGHDGLAQAVLAPLQRLQQQGVVAALAATAATAG